MKRENMTNVYLVVSATVCTSATRSLEGNTIYCTNQKQIRKTGYEGAEADKRRGEERKKE
jgi:rRNA processing protein Gar1